MAKYKTRNEKGRVDGPFSERELLSRISRGKVGVDDELSADPFVSWEKVSSHPVFYDAFLRLFFELPQGDVGSEAGSASKRSQQSVSGPKEKFTQQEAEGLGKTRVVDELGDAPGGTRNIKREGGTVHQSEIDQLFSEVGAGVAGEEDLHSPQKEPVFAGEGEGGTRTELMAYEPRPNTQLTIPFETEAFLNRDKATPQDLIVAEAQMEKEAFQKKVRLRAFAVGFSVLALGLLLFNSVPNKKLLPTEEKKIARADLAPLLGGDISVKTTALIKEADLLRQYDSPVFFKGGVDALKEALSLKEGNAGVFARASEMTAYLYYDADESKKETLHEESQKYIARGRQLDPHASAIYRAEAVLLMRDLNFSEARTKAVAAIESDPHNPEGAVLLGEITAYLGDQARTKLAYQEALKINPGLIRARVGLANIALAEGNATMAKEQASEALKISPFYPPAFLVLGRLARAQKDMSTARGMMEMAGRYGRLAFREAKVEIYSELADLYEVGGQSAEAEKLYQLAYLFGNAGQQEKLKAKLKSVPSADQTEELEALQTYSAAQFLEIGIDLQNKGRTSESTRFYLAASLLSPDDAVPLNHLGEAAEKVALSYEDYRYVMNIYERAIQRDPAQPKAYIRLGILETEQYNWDRAFLLLSQASVLAPNKAETYVALGRYYYKKQDYLEALKQLSLAHDINSSDSEVQYYAGLIRLVLKKDSIKEALPFFARAYAANPQNYDAMVEWLKLKVLSFDKNFAVKFIKNSIEKEPTNSKFYWALGEVYAANNEYHRAIDAYHKALDLDNRDSKVRMSLGTALQAVGDIKNAIEEYRLASVLDRKNSEGLYRAADLLFQARSYNQAEELLRHLISLTPNYPGAHRYLAKVHAVKQQKELAIEEMQKEVANNPENYRFVIELAELFMEYEMYDRAVTELSRVSNLPSVAKSPQYLQDKTRAYLLLSRCFRAQNRNESAEASIRLALELDANDPELHRELGYVYYALQRDKEGVKAFQFYLSRSPAATDGEIIRGLIQKMMIEE